MASTRALNMYNTLLAKEMYTRQYRDPDDDSVVDIQGINAEVDMQINFFNSGGAAATAGVGTAGAATLAGTGTATATGFAATGFAQAIPVVGQIIGVVATCVAIGQVFHNQDKIGQYKRILSKTKATLAEQETILANSIAQHNIQVGILNNEIAYREAQIARTQQMNTFVIIGIGVSGLLFVYGIARLQKKY